MSRAQNRHPKPQGYGVFSCRVCGQPMVGTLAWISRGMKFSEAWRAGYCSVAHLKEGRRNGWADKVQP